MKVRFLEEAVPLKNCPNALLSMFHKINRMKIQDKRLEDRKLSVIGHGKSLNPLYSTYMTDGREGKFFYTETLTVFSFSYAVKDSTNHASALNGVAVLNSGTGHLKSIFNFDEDTDKLPGAENSANLARKVVRELSRFPEEKILEKFKEYREKYESSIFC